MNVFPSLAHLHTVPFFASYAWPLDLNPEDPGVILLDATHCRDTIGFLREMHQQLRMNTEGCSWEILNEALHDLSWRPAPSYLFVIQNAEQLFADAPYEWQNLQQLFHIQVDSQSEKSEPQARNLLLIFSDEAAWSDWKQEVPLPGIELLLEAN